MTAIAKSVLRGYEALRKRIDAAFDLLQETRAVDFKESVNWSDYKIKFTETIMAMSNLRDGGIIIIGVAEENKNWKLRGVSDNDFATYNPDDMIDFVNKYASPVAKFEVVQHELDGVQFLIINVHEFDSEPVVCKRADNKDLKNGAIYIRPIGKPESRAIKNAEELRELLDMAIEKKMRRLAGQVQRIFGTIPPIQAQDQQKFDQELGGL